MNEKKILLIEDEPDLQDIYKLRFAQAGYDIVIAGDGKTGLELIEKNMPDLILLDIVLPKMSGYQILEAIRSKENTKHLVVYILSNLGQNGEIKHGFDEGADGYLIKSNLTPTQLVEDVEKIFRGEQVGIKRPETSAAGLNSFDDPGAETEAGAKKILLIEDEDNLVSLYQKSFENSGFAVRTAKNGAWGLKLADQEYFDLVVMDMMMPAMGGLETITRLKENDRTKDIPVIIISNSAQDKDMESALAQGAIKYLLKAKLTPSHLVEEAKKVLGI